MFQKISFYCVLVSITIVLGFIFLRFSKDSDHQRSSSTSKSKGNNLYVSRFGLVPDLQPWVDYPVPELKPRWDSPFSGFVSFTAYPMPSLIPGFALRDHRLLYWYPRKLREDREVSVEEVEALFAEKFPVRFKIGKKFWYKKTRVYVGYMNSFPKVPFNPCTKVSFVLGVGDYSGRQDLGGSFLPDRFVAKYLHTNDFEASTPSNILLATRNLKFCVGDTEQSEDARFQEFSWLKEKLFTLMPDRPRGYG